MHYEILLFEKRNFKDDDTGMSVHPFPPDTDISTATHLNAIRVGIIAHRPGSFNLQYSSAVMKT